MPHNRRFHDVEISQALAVATSICFYRAVLAGLGRHQRTLSPHELTTYYKVGCNVGYDGGLLR